MASQYKNLFFDLDDTLWAFSLNARDTFEEMYHKYDYGRFFRSFLHFYTLYQHRNTELWEEYGRGQVSKEELNRQRFLYPLEAVGTFVNNVLAEHMEKYRDIIDETCHRKFKEMMVWKDSSICR